MEDLENNADVQNLHSQNVRMYILLIGRLLPISAYVQHALYPQAQSCMLYLCSRRFWTVMKLVGKTDGDRTWKQERFQKAF